MDNNGFYRQNIKNEAHYPAILMVSINYSRTHGESSSVRKICGNNSCKIIIFDYQTFFQTIIRQWYLIFPAGLNICKNRINSIEKYTDYNTKFFIISITHINRSVLS